VFVVFKVYVMQLIPVYEIVIKIVDSMLWTRGYTVVMYTPAGISGFHQSRLPANLTQYKLNILLFIYL
jgi:hypothetical protein